MGIRKNVGVLAAGKSRHGSRIALDDNRRLKPRRSGRVDELLTEFSEGEVRATAFNERKRGGIPERRRTAVSQNDFVTGGQSIQFGEAGADTSDEFADWLLPMRRSEKMSMTDQVLNLLGSNLGRTAAETTVDGNQVCWQSEVAHSPILVAAHNPEFPQKSPRAGSRFGSPSAILIPLR